MRSQRVYAKITVGTLQAKVLAAFESEDEGIAHWKLSDALGGDLKVEFDFENFEYLSDAHGFGPPGLIGLVELGNGLTFWGMCAGGDWEHPVYWIVYWDGRKLRAYVPTDGNPWNRKTKKAWGNGEDENGDEGGGFDSGLILNDILRRLTPKG